jgi:hypothetical protein
MLTVFPDKCLAKTWEVKHTQTSPHWVLHKVPPEASDVQGPWVSKDAWCNGGLVHERVEISGGGPYYCEMRQLV